MKKHDEDKPKERQFLRSQLQVQRIRRELIESLQKAKVNGNFDGMQQKLKNENKFQGITKTQLEQRIKHSKRIGISPIKDLDEKNSSGQKIERLQSHIHFCEEEMYWMTNFIISFLRMTDKLMNRFNQSIIKEHWTMKKKTKTAWRYIKHFLEWFFKPARDKINQN